MSIPERLQTVVTKRWFEFCWRGWQGSRTPCSHPFSPPFLPRFSSFEPSLNLTPASINLCLDGNTKPILETAVYRAMESDAVLGVTIAKRAGISGGGVQPKAVHQSCRCAYHWLLNPEPPRGRYYDMSSPRVFRCNFRGRLRQKYVITKRLIHQECFDVSGGCGDHRL